MDDPFFRTCYPHGGFYRQAPPSGAPIAQPKKVVSVPIRFVASENSKSDSALKIQKAFRGFRVRKNVQKILGIRREVDQVEKKLLETETVDLIKKDPKERLKMNEFLMNLLFRLDSVGSVNASVRDCRKAAIKKAILLQERIDSFVASVDDEVKDSGEEEAIDSAVDAGELKERTDNSGVEIFEDLNQVEMLENRNNGGRVGVETEAEAWECVGEGREGKSEFVEISETDKCGGGNLAKRCSDEWCVVSGHEEESKRSRKLLEKMAEDNQKLMAMMAELCDRSAAHATLISSLSHRVELLEKAISHTSTKNKNKNKNKNKKKKKKKKNLNGTTLTTAP